MNRVLARSSRWRRQRIHVLHTNCRAVFAQAPAICPDMAYFRVVGGTQSEPVLRSCICQSDGRNDRIIYRTPRGLPPLIPA